MAGRLCTGMHVPSQQSRWVRGKLTGRPHPMCAGCQMAASLHPSGAERQCNFPAVMATLLFGKIQYCCTRFPSSDRRAHPGLCQRAVPLLRTAVPAPPAPAAQRQPAQTWVHICLIMMVGDRAAASGAAYPHGAASSTNEAVLHQMDGCIQTRTTSSNSPVSCPP